MRAAKTKYTTTLYNIEICEGPSWYKGLVESTFELLVNIDKLSLQDIADRTRSSFGICETSKTAYFKHYG